MTVIKYFLIIVSIMMLFALTSNEAKADEKCPEGYVNKTVTITVDGCDYLVDLCVRCNNGPVPVALTIYINEIIDLSAPACSTSFTFSEIIEQIEFQLQNYDFIYTYLCDPVVYPPPCEELVFFEHTMYHWSCFYVENLMYFGQMHRAYRPCDTDSYCEETWAYCFDTVLGKVIKVMVSPPTQVGTPNCSLESWEIEVPPGLGVSECYIQHNPCNP